MKTLYRLLRRPFSATPFDGEGSYLYGGRWSRPGTRLVYTAEHLSLAMVEYLAHVDANKPPRDLMLATAQVPDDLATVRLKVEELPHGWRSYPPPGDLQAIGDRFAREGLAAALIVPSVLAVTDHNWVLNPAHLEFHRITFNPAMPFGYDPRLLKTGRV